MDVFIERFKIISMFQSKKINYYSSLSVQSFFFVDLFYFAIRYILFQSIIFHQFSYFPIKINLLYFIHRTLDYAIKFLHCQNFNYLFF